MDIWENFYLCFLHRNRMNCISRNRRTCFGQAGTWQCKDNSIARTVLTSATTKGRQKLVGSLEGVCADNTWDLLGEGVEVKGKCAEAVCWSLCGHGSCPSSLPLAWSRKVEINLMFMNLFTFLSCRFFPSREGSLRGEKNKLILSMTPWKD